MLIFQTGSKQAKNGTFLYNGNMLPGYTKEFKFSLGKKYFTIILLSLFFTVLCFFVISFVNEYRLAITDILGIIIFVLCLFFIGTFLGYMLAYKKIVFIYDNNVINLLFEHGYGNSQNKEFSVNLENVKEYQERHIFRGSGVLQFFMKDNSVVEVPYSSSLDMYKNVRQEILRVLDDKYIEKTCVF